MTRRNSSKSDDLSSFDDDYDVFSDPDYMRYAGEVITNALRDECDVVQFPDGDILVTAVRTVMHRYSWDADNNNMSKVELELEANQAAAKQGIAATVAKILEDA